MTRIQPGSVAGEGRSVVIGTAGHIDHGKSSLVRALTGTDPDRLPEEKARGITIDLGFAALDLTGPAGERLEISLVDVPGHHAFVRNMLAGAGGIDAVMLVVAADEGVKAQTVEHLQICRLLGIRLGLVALTKRDAVGEERLAAARSEVAALVQGTFLEGAPVVPLSALRRDGLNELRAVLTQVAAAVPARREDRVLRLPIDRVFSVRGFGTVVTGTLQAGHVRAGTTLRLEPRGRAVRVRGVQVHGATRNEAHAPNRVALNLAGLEVADLSRGDVLLPEETLQPMQNVDVEIEMLKGAPVLRHRQRIRVHAFASESLATVLLYETSESARPLARLRLQQPMVLVPEDRFVLRRLSPAMTVGGGRVLDAHPVPRSRKAATASWLTSLQNASATETLHMRVRRRGVAGTTASRLVAETGWTAEAVRAWLAAAVASGQVVEQAGQPLLLSAEAAAQAEAYVLRELQKGITDGVGRTELRARTGLGDAALTLILRRLQASRQLEVQGELVRLPGLQAAKTSATTLQGPALAVEQLYRSAGLAAPTVSEAAERLRMDTAKMRGILTTLLRAGLLVRMGSDALLVHQTALARLTAELQAKHRGRSFDVGWFKSFTGLTRKHAIPLLEYLDGARTTRNVGGTRTVL